MHAAATTSTGTGEFRYRAFLSYRTSDFLLAQKLHRALENYRVPAQLVGRTTTQGLVRERIGAVFRDRDDARTAEDIETTIAQELSKSQHLIVLCTPRTREPASWVSREIELFRSRRSGGLIHAVIGDGEPPNCFPHVLLRTDSEGRTRVPLAADMRRRRDGGQDGFERAIVKIVAGLIGLDFDELWRRERRRQLQRRSALGALAGACALLVAGAYSYTELSRFVREEGEHLVLYKGRVGLNPPGYPKPVWTFSTTTERLQLPAGADPTRFVVAASPRENVLTKLDAVVRPDYRAADAYERGDAERAHTLALSLISDPAGTPEYKLNAKLVLALVATAQDVPLLRAMLREERREVRLSAARALFRIDADTTLGELAQLPSDQVDWMAQELAHLAQPPCGPRLAAFLQSTFQTRASHPTNSELIDAALRSGCPIQRSALVEGLKRPALSGDSSITLFAQLTGQSAQLADDVYAALAAPDLDEWRRGGLINSLRILGTPNCKLDLLQQGLDAHIRLSRMQSMAAIARLCPDHKLGFALHGATSIVVTLRRASGTAVREERIDVADRSLSVEARFVAELVTDARPQDVVAMLRKLLAHAGDDIVRARIIRSLSVVGDREPLPPDLLATNNLDVRSAAVEHGRKRDEHRVADELIRMIGGSDQFFVGHLGRIPLTPAQMRAIQPLLGGGREQRSQVACVLAMQGPPPVVNAMLTSPDAEIRGQAADCASYNPAAAALVATMPDTSGGIPLSHYHVLRGQVAQRLQLEQELAGLTPQQRLVRLQVMDLTPAGFGRWRKGMRFWIEEQRHQLAGARPAP